MSTWGHQTSFSGVLQGAGLCGWVKQTTVEAEKDPEPRERRGAEQKNLEHGTGCAGKIRRMNKTELGRA